MARITGSALTAVLTPSKEADSASMRILGCWMGLVKPMVMPARSLRGKPAIRVVAKLFC
jgi:hypothetical protein